MELINPNPKTVEYLISILDKIKVRRNITRQIVRRFARESAKNPLLFSLVINYLLKLGFAQLRIPLKSTLPFPIPRRCFGRRLPSLQQQLLWAVGKGRLFGRIVTFHLDSLGCEVEWSALPSRSRLTFINACCVVRGSSTEPDRAASSPLFTR